MIASIMMLFNQISEICANEPEFLQLCGNIACPPFEDECTPGTPYFIEFTLIVMNNGMPAFLRSEGGRAIDRRRNWV